MLNGLNSAKIFEPNVEGLGGEMCVDIQHTWYDTCDNTWRGRSNIAPISPGALLFYNGKGYWKRILEKIVE